MHALVTVQQRIDVGQRAFIAQFREIVGVILERVDLRIDDRGLLLLESLEQRPELGGLFRR